MHINVYPVIKNDQGIKRKNGFVLRNLDEFKKAFQEAIDVHPFRDNGGNKCKNIDFRINVIVDGNHFLLESQVPDTKLDSARIDFGEYLKNHDNAVEITLHYAVYIGKRPEDVTNIMSFGDGCLPPEEKCVKEKINQIEGDNFDAKGIRIVLFHELGHFFDVIDPNFKYSSDKFKEVNNESIYGLVNKLWDCYIDRRLQKFLRWEDIYAYNKPQIGRGMDIVDKIWNGNDDYVFDRLIVLAKKIKSR